MSNLSRKEPVRRYVDAFNRGDVDAVCDCFAPGALVYGVLGWGAVPKVRLIWKQLVNCFGMQLQIDGMAQEGDIVAVRYTERGKFVQAYRGIVLTGKAYAVVAMEWFEVVEARIVRRWGARDSASIFGQMGIPTT